jgi:hypothetical protein
VLAEARLAGGSWFPPRLTLMSVQTRGLFHNLVLQLREPYVSRGSSQEAHSFYPIYLHFTHDFFFTPCSEPAKEICVIYLFQTGGNVNTKDSHFLIVSVLSFFNVPRSSEYEEYENYDIETKI